MPQATPITPPPPDPAGRADVVVITNVPTPYRLALHRRIDTELRAIRLLTIYTHDIADQAWSLDTGDAAARTFCFGRGDAVNTSSRLSSFRREFAKGGRIVAFLKQVRPAAILLCGYNDPGRLRILAFARRAGIKVFLVADSNLRGESLSGLKGLLKPPFVRTIVRLCHGLMPCGTYGGDYFKKYGADPARIFFVPYEPDYALIESLPESFIAQTAARLALAPDRKRMVFCGRMIDIKRPLHAVRAFLALAAQRPDWDLVMIGDGPEREAASAIVPADLRARVRFMGFMGDQREISAVYRASHLFLHPCVYEPWGVVINEAACAGMAIVCTDSVGAAGELVRDGVNGQLVPPDDHDGLVAAILNATDPPNLDRYRAASRAVLADWRLRGDPIAGLRAALATANVRA